MILKYVDSDGSNVVLGEISEVKVETGIKANMRCSEIGTFFDPVDRVMTQDSHVVLAQTAVGESVKEWDDIVEDCKMVNFWHNDKPKQLMFVGGGSCFLMNSNGKTIERLI